MTAPLIYDREMQGFREAESLNTITTTTDWDTALETGPYFSDVGAAHAPTNDAAYVGDVLRMSENYIVQTVQTFGVGGHTVCRRHSYDSAGRTWTAWGEQRLDKNQQDYLLGLKTDLSTKVVGLDASNTDDQYPSAKAVYDALAGKANMGGSAEQLSTRYEIVVTGLPNEDVSYISGTNKVPDFVINHTGDIVYAEVLNT